MKGEAVIPVFTSAAPRVVLDLTNNQLNTINVNMVLQHESIVSEFGKDDERERGSQRDGSRKRETPTQVMVHLDNNPLTCDCHLEPFLQYANNSAKDYESALRGLINKVSFDFYSPSIRCAKPDGLSGRPLREVPINALVCQITDERLCPRACDCTYRANDKRVLVNCENKGLREIPSRLLSLANFKNFSLPSKASVPKVKGVTLQLGRNRISSVSGLNKLVADASSQRPAVFLELFLEDNAIRSLPEGFLATSDGNGTSFNKFVSVLSLRNNSLSSVPLELLARFALKDVSTSNASTSGVDAHQSQSTPTMLYLGQNPFNCTPDKEAMPGERGDCEILNFKSWLIQNRAIVGDMNEIRCSKTSNETGDDVTGDSDSLSGPILEVSDNVLCPQTNLSDQQALLTLTTICVVLATCLLIVSICYYRNKQTVLAFVYIHFNPIFVCLNFNETDLDEEKLYDAFLSYSSADRDVVMELIEKLEKPSEMSNSSICYLQQQSNMPSIHEGNYDQIVPEINAELKGRKETSDSSEHYSLCIHERDWLPGNLISWNIVNSVQNSRRTILILSKEFIQSIWFQVEFHTAYYQMLEDKMDRLIVVVKGELPPKEELDKDLVFLLTTKTYLTWGEKWFWEKLKYALPHKQQKVKIVPKKQSTGRTAAANGTLPGKQGKMTKAEIMKEYVDQTIANHFQLQSPSAASTPFKNGTTGGQYNSVDERNTYNERNNVVSPEANRTPRVTVKGGHVNDSFVIETET